MPQADATLRPSDLLGIDAAAVWQRLLEGYTPLLTRWAQRKGWQPADVADIVQQVFLRFWEQITHSDAERIAIQPALRAVCRQVMTVHRQNQPSNTHSGVNLAGLAISEGQGDSFQHSKDPRRRLQLTRLFRRIQWEFEPATWQAFWDTAVDRRPVAEVAQALGWPKEEVAVARYRVKKRLYKLLQRMRRR